MKALPCPRGAFKADISRAPSCSLCPSGLTTDSTSAQSASACNLAEPGFRPVLINGTAIAVEACPLGTFGADGVLCQNCTDGLTTQDVASTAETDCTAPPGYGWYADGVGDGAPITTADLQAQQQKLVRCPPGSWKVGLHHTCLQQAVVLMFMSQSCACTAASLALSVPACTLSDSPCCVCVQAGWGLEPCRSCGVNIATDTSESNGLGISADQCFIPPGFGSGRDKSQRLVAVRCSNGSYGVSERTYDLEAHPCHVILASCNLH